jgi:hypothetical protein
MKIARRMRKGTLMDDSDADEAAAEAGRGLAICFLAGMTMERLTAYTIINDSTQKLIK